MDASKIDAMASESLELADKIAPLLAGREPWVQGGALVDLVSRWLLGHHADTPASSKLLRAELLKSHVEAVVALLEQ